MSGPALLVAALLLAPGCGSAVGGSAAAAPRLAFEPARFDFGDALPGGTLTKEFSLRNVGSAPLVIENLSSSCACTAFLLDAKRRRLAPGRSAPLRVTLKTPAAAGRVVEKVRVATNDPTQPVVELEVSANVKPGR